MAFYIKVEKKSAQKRIDELKRAGRFDKAHAVIAQDGKICIPVCCKMRGSFELAGKEVSRKPKSVSEVLAGKMSAAESAALQNSFDIIGDIAIVEIPTGLESWEKEIAGAIMGVHRNVKVVAKKEGPMEGIYRTRRLKVILGEKRTETVYTESGARMMLDVAKVYFSPRLSFERTRIAGLVKDGESILALFAGVGPFPLVISKVKKGKCKIVAIELNPIAVEYMRKNAALNKAKMEVVEGDVNEVVPRDYQNFADRVLMPLPKDAEDFLKAAYEGAKDGATIHFYTFAGIEKPFEEAIEKIYAHLPRGKVEILSQRIVRPFSPSTCQVVIDLRVRK